MPPGRLNLVVGSSLGAVLLVGLALGQSQPPHDDIGKTLPRTNLSSDGAVNRSGLPRPHWDSPTPRGIESAGAGRGEWLGKRLASPAINWRPIILRIPCIPWDCTSPIRSDPTFPLCEACHGPGSEPCRQAANQRTHHRIYQKFRHPDRYSDENLPDLSRGRPARSLAGFSPPAQRLVLQRLSTTPWQNSQYRG